ncbi:MAG: helix-turn-helix domain-containing protein [Brevundimonas sp.]|uniref:helix-turn-helix domain-containing protein n=1 Tax=Brevundimonas sp. TaxID=1871086 RepID=UPI00391885F6
MNRLEQLGFDTAAKRALGVRPQEGEILRRLVIASPAAVHLEQLRMSGYQWDRRVSMPVSQVRALVSRLREALADIGHADCIETIGGFGYAIRDPATADTIRAMVEAAA